MDPSRIGLFALVEKRLAWTDRRQTLLAENVANADTPGWRARDVTPFAKLLAGAQPGLAPAETSPGHLPGRPPEAAAAMLRPGEHSPDGNSVSLDRELARIADTNAAHTLTTNLYMKYLSMFRTALGRS